MKLQDLKAKVFAFASVTTTRELKKKFEGVKSLDFRKKTSWETALELVQTQKSEFETWLENPPEEFRELFAETTEAMERYDRKLNQADALAKEALSMADQIDELAKEYREDAIELERRVKRSKKMAEQAERN